MPWGTDGLYVESNPGARTWGGIAGVLGAGLQSYREASDKRRGEEREDAKETRQDKRLVRTEQGAWEREKWRTGRTEAQNQIALALQMGSPEMFEAAYRQAYPENGVASAWRQTFGGGDYFKRRQEDREWDLAEKKRVADMATRTMSLQEAQEQRQLAQMNQLTEYQMAMLTAQEAAKVREAQHQQALLAAQEATKNRPIQVGKALVTSEGKALYAEPEQPTYVYDAVSNAFVPIPGKFASTIREPIQQWDPASGKYVTVAWGDKATFGPKPGGESSAFAMPAREGSAGTPAAQAPPPAAPAPQPPIVLPPPPAPQRTPPPPKPPKPRPKPKLSTGAPRGVERPRGLTP